jgi:arginine/serine-rich splicing factor 4/5/6
MEDVTKEAVAEAATVTSDQGEVREVIGSAALRPVFLGNLSNTYTAEDVTAIFEGPQQPPAGKEDSQTRVYSPIPVDRIDLKRGYCFVFLKDAVTQQDKEQAELFVAALNGM